MLEVKNRTPFAAGLAPGLDEHGVEHAVVVVKGTFALRGSGRVEVGPEQMPVSWADAFHGEPGASSVKHAGDGALHKPCADAYLVGSARPASGRSTHVDVALAMGASIRKVVRVFGDRRWSRRFGRWSASAPLPFEEMPLLWERAYGGAEPDPADAARPRFDPRNPVGVGFAASLGSAEGAPLPNLEDPRQLISSPRDRPEPAGVGAVAAHWQARARWAGTYDAAWRHARCPLLPLDFDPRFHQVAPPGQIAAGPLAGGEPVRIAGVSRGGPLLFSLPSRKVLVSTRIRGSEAIQAAALDTVLIEPDRGRVVLTWRASVRCGRDFSRLERVLVKEAA